MEPVYFIAFAALFGGAGYFEARRHQKEFGHAPGGLPVALWGAVCAVTLIVGAILLLIAARTDKAIGLSPDAVDTHPEAHIDAPANDPEVPMKPISQYPV